MADGNTVDRVRSLFTKDNEQEYTRVYTDAESDQHDPIVRRPFLIRNEDNEDEDDVDESDKGSIAEVAEPFSRFDYFIFMLLGIAMLWAW